ncbi:hypothetical protein 20Sep418_00048 [Pseudomonas phage 20Sep418]|uniref:Uncharacterized protein n=7 Tax=Pakpunavirus TaxID=1921407 RepID=A0A9E6U5P3_9CAUD|nr:hypothetical protein QE325_gp192 [Pseudomonas phage pPA-3099-2aT.2]YP_010763306.1 hypothetical protein QE329_gp146 [Pseudomonas phage PhL_UNISO_PA-DSM_ph0034]YP_010763638.1 hypothetical protein QE331_gp114 [Pseudomonas phage 20Sep416]YP_010765287.1 hypothetical protein QE347_gp179 [Pseudomonas phage vB_Paer_Ps12]YP_010765483.1 hypothetical protein QE348_gp187 [Pseudomonas phage vB_Paer_PsIn]YP_010765683.1 hypothetical protein QE349_gp190 [Pseudomonas phage vB_Paer_PsCh]UOL47822.1 hypotheti
MPWLYPIPLTHADEFGEGQHVGCIGLLSFRFRVVSTL